MQVPFLDLRAHHDPLKGEFLAAIEEVIDSSAFAGGSFVAEFEEEFAAFCKTKYAIGVGNGTDALWFSLLALGVGPGDEVITVPMTFMATAEAITYCGAKPVFVDICPKTYTMDPALLEQAITPRTKAIIPVHLFGQPADMDPILHIAQRHGLPVVEDACQAHGAEYKGRMAGSIGDTGCFSFYPGKNLGAFGEAGAIVTNDSAIRDRLQMLRDHGQAKKYYHTVVGWNGRMDGIQAAVLRIKLRHLERNNALRRAHAAYYGTHLSTLRGLTLPAEASYAKHVYHIYDLCVANRDRFVDGLTLRGVNCRIHYPVPIHLQEAYSFLGLKKGAFPTAEQCADESVSLPMFPELTREQLAFVVQQIQDFFRETKA